MTSHIDGNALLVGSFIRSHTPKAAPVAPERGAAVVVNTIPISQGGPDTCGAAAATMAVWTLGNSSFEGDFPRGGRNLSLAEIEDSLERTTALSAYPVEPSRISSEVQQGNPMIALLRNPGASTGHHVLLDGWRSQGGESQVRIADPLTSTHHWVSEGRLAQLLGTSDGTSRVLAVSKGAGPHLVSATPPSKDDGGGASSNLSTFRFE